MSTLKVAVNRLDINNFSGCKRGMAVSGLKMFGTAAPEQAAYRLLRFFQKSDRSRFAHSFSL